MRRQGLSTANIIVFIETNPFKKQDRQYRASQSVQLPIATSDTGRLVAAAKNGLRRIWAEGYKYKKAGVMLLDLVPASGVQGSLLISQTLQLRLPGCGPLTLSTAVMGATRL